MTATDLLPFMLLRRAARVKFVLHVHFLRRFWCHIKRQLDCVHSVVMPPAKKPRWEIRPQRTAAPTQPAESYEADEATGHEADEATGPPKLTAEERRQLFARLLWLDDYKLVFAAEAAMHAPLLTLLTARYTSAYTRRLMRSDSTAGERARQAVEERLRANVGFLERSANVHHIPIEQAAKGVVYYASGVSTPVWVAERKARHVVGRQYAEDLLKDMACCRPEPPFEQQDCSVISTIIFDQTYAKAGAGTGISAYNAVQTVDARGERMQVERMVYINGQFVPASRASTTFSPSCLARIAATGPYTQDFRRILPLLQPDRLDGVMDSYVQRTVRLLGGQPPPSTRTAMETLLSRPNDDPGHATYLIFMNPLLWVNTAAYVDLIRIVHWCMSFLACTPLILHLIGDGASVLMLRNLKRMHPEQYKHVVIGNGHMHSGAHSQFADITLWWWALLCTCMVTIGKVEQCEDGTFKGTVRPSIKSLEANAVEHTQQALLAVSVAIIVFFTTRVKSPPPELFLSDPIAYFARIQNASGIVLYQFLRHSGLPTLVWQRGTRGREGATLDDLHCLALHKFRCAHKTNSSEISLLHLISIYGTHPELRAYLQQRLFVNMTPNIGSAVGADKSLECMNEVQKEHNIGGSLIQSLGFSRLIQPLQHVYRQWKIAMGTLAGSGTGIRASMENEIDALVRMMDAKVGPDLETYTTHNTLWYTGTPVEMRTASNLKRGRPWEWIWRVAAGRSGCMRKPSQDSYGRWHEIWSHWTERHIREHMFYM